MAEFNNDTFLIIDGNSIGCRAIKVQVPGKPELQTKDGFITGGIFRFINMLDSILYKIRPTHIIVVFDTSINTFRKELDPNYKANRVSTIDPNSNENHTTREQLKYIKQFLNTIDILTDNIEGFEGDDLVGTYAKLSPANKTFILSGDKDCFQLIDDTISVLFPITGFSNIGIYNEKKFKERYNIDVEQFIDFKCLVGDTGDNIKGLTKCGDKSATKILQQFGNVNSLFNNLNKDDIDIRGWKSLKKNIEEWKSNYNLTKELVTIRTDVPVKYKYNDCKININWRNSLEFLEQLEFNSLISKLKHRQFYKMF